ncbi:hypothetical protein FC650_12905 [Vibrio natriegens]|nr:hypothetical protein [Vibrio natriegens]
MDYALEACRSGVKDKIVELAMNGYGLRETGRVLNNAYNTVLNT